MFNEAAFREVSGLELEAGLGAGEIDALMAALETEPPVSVRLNPYKASTASGSFLSPATHPLEGNCGIIEGLTRNLTTPVAWCSEGYYLPERPNFTFDPAFHAGAYYVQEASSMFVGWLLREFLQQVEANSEQQAKAAGSEDAGSLRLLDLCAAPGGKTTLYSAMLGELGVVVANEVVRSRAGVLVDNIKRWGIGNVVVTAEATAKFAAAGELFDVVAVDAPCSGEGMFRKDLTAREQWSPELVDMCAARQRQILADAWQALKPGGLLIYSTCTFNRRENEDNIAWLIGQVSGARCQVSDNELPDPNIVVTWVGDIPCFRFFPHKTQGEGFFACAISKKVSGVRYQVSDIRQNTRQFQKIEQVAASTLSKYLLHSEAVKFSKFGECYYALSEEIATTLSLLDGKINTIYSGVAMGDIFKGRLKPDHALALNIGLNRDAFSVAELSLDDALTYLRGGALSPALFSDGINLVTHRGLSFGWANCIGRSRINNLYPKSMMIKKGA